MKITPVILDKLIQAANDVIELHAEEVAELDRNIGDGDHVINIQRGLKVLVEQKQELSELDWASAWSKLGMSCMSKIGGASGSLLGTLFLGVAKDLKDKEVDTLVFANAFSTGVDAMKARGKSDAGEKTMLDVLVPVANALQQQAESAPLTELLTTLKAVAIAGMESTEGMLATKGRASFLGERSLGHIDAGARSSQLIICAICDVLLQEN